MSLAPELETKEEAKAERDELVGVVNSTTLKPAASAKVKRSKIPDDAVCRICSEGDSLEKPLFYPCECSGSMRHVHSKCLIDWLEHSGKDHCEVCQFRYRFQYGEVDGQSASFSLLPQSFSRSMRRLFFGDDDEAGDPAVIAAAQQPGIDHNEPAEQAAVQPDGEILADGGGDGIIPDINDEAEIAPIVGDASTDEIKTARNDECKNSDNEKEKEEEKENEQRKETEEEKKGESEAHPTTAEGTGPENRLDPDPNSNSNPIHNQRGENLLVIPEAADVVDAPARELRVAPIVPVPRLVDEGIHPNAQGHPQPIEGIMPERREGAANVSLCDLIQFVLVAGLSALKETCRLMIAVNAWVFLFLLNGYFAFGYLPGVDRVCQSTLEHPEGSAYRRRFSTRPRPFNVSEFRYFNGSSNSTSMITDTISGMKSELREAAALDLSDPPCVLTYFDDHWRVLPTNLAVGLLSGVLVTVVYTVVYCLFSFHHNQNRLDFDEALLFNANGEIEVGLAPELRERAQRMVAQRNVAEQQADGIDDLLIFPPAEDGGGLLREADLINPVAPLNDDQNGNDDDERVPDQGLLAGDPGFANQNNDDNEDRVPPLENGIPDNENNRNVQNQQQNPVDLAAELSDEDEEEEEEEDEDLDEEEVGRDLDEAAPLIPDVRNDVDGAHEAAAPDANRPEHIDHDHNVPLRQNDQNNHNLNDLDIQRLRQELQQRLRNNARLQMEVAEQQRLENERLQRQRRQRRRRRRRNRRRRGQGRAGVNGDGPNAENAPLEIGLADLVGLGRPDTFFWIMSGLTLYCMTVTALTLYFPAAFGEWFEQMTKLVAKSEILDVSSQNRISNFHELFYLVLLDNKDVIGYLTGFFQLSISKLHELSPSVTIIGYFALSLVILLIFLMDCSYYRFVRPHLVRNKRRRSWWNTRYKVYRSIVLKGGTPKFELINKPKPPLFHSLWCVIESISRGLCPFWRAFDSMLRLIDCLFQVVFVPYMFGLCIFAATACLRQSPDSAALMAGSSGMSAFDQNQDVSAWAALHGLFDGSNGERTGKTHDNGVKVDPKVEKHFKNASDEYDENDPEKHNANMEEEEEEEVEEEEDQHQDQDQEDSDDLSDSREHVSPEDLTDAALVTFLELISSIVVGFPVFGDARALSDIFLSEQDYSDGTSLGSGIGISPAGMAHSTTDSSLYQSRRRLFEILETFVLECLLTWAIGFCYIWSSMHFFNESRSILRPEFNALWMRWPLNVPLSLSAWRAMKERIVSLRVHVLFLVGGILIPSKLCVRLFPSLFPLSTVAFTARSTLKNARNSRGLKSAMIFVFAFSVALLMRRMRLKERVTALMRGWFENVTFMFGLNYFCIKGGIPAEGQLGLVEMEVMDDDQHAEDDQHPPPVPVDLLGLQQPNDNQNNNQNNDGNVNDDGHMMEEEEQREGAVDIDEVAAVAQRILEAGNNNNNNNNNNNENGVGNEAPNARDPVNDEDALAAREERRRQRRRQRRRRRNRDENGVRGAHGSNRSSNNASSSWLKRMDAQFLKPHPWFVAVDTYTVLQQERQRLIQKAQEYSLGIDHLPLRLFGLIITFWMSVMVGFIIVVCLPLICGRMAISLLSDNEFNTPQIVELVNNNDYLSSSSMMNSSAMMMDVISNDKYTMMNNLNHNDHWDPSMEIVESSLRCYVIGLVLCLCLPLEWVNLWQIYENGELGRHFRRLIVRLCMVGLLPLIFGYFWCSMIFNFSQSLNESMLVSLTELYPTGVYVTSVYLLLQNANDLEITLAWLQARGEVNLALFWNEWLKPVLKTIVIHISFPLAIRYWFIMIVITSKHQSSQMSTLMIDVDAIGANLHHQQQFNDQMHSNNDPSSLDGAGAGSGSSSLSSSKMNHMGNNNTSSLFDEGMNPLNSRWDDRTLDDINKLKSEINNHSLSLSSMVDGTVALHYNLYELSLFLQSQPLRKLMNQITSYSVIPSQTSHHNGGVSVWETAEWYFDYISMFMNYLVFGEDLDLRRLEKRRRKEEGLTEQSIDDGIKEDENEQELKQSEREEQTSQLSSEDWAVIWAFGDFLVCFAMTRCLSVILIWLRLSLLCWSVLLFEWLPGLSQKILRFKYGGRNRRLLNNERNT